MVKFINYEGEKLPIRVSYFALKMMKEKADVGLADLSADSYEAYETLLFYSLMQGHKKLKKEFTIKEDEIGDIMDECFFDFLKIVPQFFSDMEGTAKPTTKVQAKKNVVKK